jgi:hypothetical protein
MGYGCAREGVRQARNPYDPVVASLKAELKDENRHVRRHAAYALGKMGEVSALKELIIAMNDEGEDWLVRLWAAELVGKMGDSRGVEMLMPVLKSDWEHARGVAAKSLGEIGDTRALGPLKAMLQVNQNVDVRKKAQEAIDKLEKVRQENAHSGKEVPAIKKADGQYVLTLPSMAKEALHRYDPSFKIWAQDDYLPTLIKLYQFSPRQTPFAVIGDFNGDGISDVALHGRNNSNDLVVAVLSSGQGFKVVEIDRSSLTIPEKERYGMGDGKTEHGQWVYLVSASAGKKESSYEDRPLKLKTDAFEIVCFEKAAVLHYYEDGKFLRYTTAD